MPFHVEVPWYLVNFDDFHLLSILLHFVDLMLGLGANTSLIYAGCYHTWKMLVS